MSPRWSKASATCLAYVGGVVGGDKWACKGAPRDAWACPEHARAAFRRFSRCTRRVHEMGLENLLVSSARPCGRSSPDIWDSHRLFVGLATTAPPVTRNNRLRRSALLPFIVPPHPVSSKAGWTDGTGALQDEPDRIQCSRDEGSLWVCQHLHGPTHDVDRSRLTSTDRSPYASSWPSIQEPSCRGLSRPAQSGRLRGSVRGITPPGAPPCPAPRWLRDTRCGGRGPGGVSLGISALEALGSIPESGSSSF